MAFSSSGRLGAAQNVAFTGTSAASTAFGTQTYQIRIVSTAACRVLVGDGTPTALTTSSFLPPNWVDVVTVTPGQKIAVIQDVGAGTLSVTELV